MKNTEWNDFDYLNHIDNNEKSPYDERKSAKARKRKWREIETIKEKQRLRRELSDVYHYS